MIQTILKIVVWLVIGQSITLLAKDKTLRQKMKKKYWREKLKLLGDSLLNFNKKIITEIGDSKLSDELWERKNTIINQFSDWESELDMLKKNIQQKTKQEAKKIIDQREKQKNNVIEEREDLKEWRDTEKDIKEKLEIIKKKFQSIRDSIGKKIENKKNTVKNT